MSGTEPTPGSPLTDEQIHRVTIGAPEVHNGPITLAESDPRWPEQFAREEARIRAALGDRQ